jgi:hypothetical protein
VHRPPVDRRDVGPRPDPLVGMERPAAVAAGESRFVNLVVIGDQAGLLRVVIQRQAGLKIIP